MTEKQIDSPGIISDIDVPILDNQHPLGRYPDLKDIIPLS